MVLDPFPSFATYQSLGWRSIPTHLYLKNKDLDVGWGVGRRGRQSLRFRVKTKVLADTFRICLVPRCPQSLSGCGEMEVGLGFLDQEIAQTDAPVEKGRLWIMQPEPIPSLQVNWQD